MQVNGKSIAASQGRLGGVLSLIFSRGKLSHSWSLFDAHISDALNY